jgi:hypothetical protein
MREQASRGHDLLLHAGIKHATQRFSVRHNFSLLGQVHQSEDSDPLSVQTPLGLVGTDIKYPTFTHGFFDQKLRTTSCYETLSFVFHAPVSRGSPGPYPCSLP